MIVIKRGMNGLDFPLKGKVLSLKGEGFLNQVDEKDWEEALALFGDFIKKRIVSDSNPSGVFIVRQDQKSAVQESKEAEPFEDKAAPVKAKKKGKKK